MQDDRSPGTGGDPLILPALLAGRVRIDNDFFDAGFRQRQQVIDMPVEFLFAAAMASEPRR